MNDISPELVERMVALVRDIDQRAIKHGFNAWASEAHAILNELPKPVNPDEKEVRRIAFADGVMISDKAVSLIVAYFSNRPSS